MKKFYNLGPECFSLIVFLLLCGVASSWCRGLDFDVSGHTHLLFSYQSSLARAQMNRLIEMVLSIHIQQHML